MGWVDHSPTAWNAPRPAPTQERDARRLCPPSESQPDDQEDDRQRIIDPHSWTGSVEEQRREVPRLLIGVAAFVTVFAPLAILIVSLVGLD